jgi:hypothetical protein
MDRGLAFQPFLVTRQSKRRNSKDYIKISLYLIEVLLHRKQVFNHLLRYETLYSTP